MTKYTKHPEKRSKATGAHDYQPPRKSEHTTQFTPKVLASGVDTLNLALDIRWRKPTFFEYLDLAKTAAIELEKPFPFFLNIPSQRQDIYFNVQPNGAKGYQWLISGSEYALRIGNWIEPKSRPSAMLEVRSETIWTNGLAVAIEKILTGLQENGAQLKTVKPSRLDLCMDILIPSELWNLDLFNFMSTRAQHFSPFFKNKQLTGVQIGKGKIVCRIYDKALEIKSKSNKKWMYLIWETPEPPENMKVIRIEFQIRRELIKSLGINTIKDAFPFLGNIWAYCTFDWLKFQSNPGKHHTQRETLDWWKTVQTSYDGISAPIPAIRAKAALLSQNQLAYQITGLLTSFAASGKYFPPNPLYTKDDLLELCGQAIDLTCKSTKALTFEAEQKRAKYFRTNREYQSKQQKRIALGLPTEHQIFEIKKSK